MIDATGVSMVLHGVHRNDLHKLLDLGLVKEAEQTEGLKRYEVRIRCQFIQQAMEVLSAPWRA